jgi:N-acetylneuraminic acid mutarotase
VVKTMTKVATTDRLSRLITTAPKPPSKPGAAPKARANLSLAKAKVGGNGKKTVTAKVQTDMPVKRLMPLFDANFEGVSADAPNPCGCLPPDTEGDVGPNHYIQWVNTAFQIFAKDGTALTDPLPGNIFWTGQNSVCATTNDGDPIVQYDAMADRWFFSQFAFPNFPNGPFTQCVAISTTGDPLGSYYLYQYDTPSGKLNDYPKFSVWPDAYYQTINQYSAGALNWAGAGVFALERDKMLAGQSAQIVYFDLFGVESYFGGMLPADAEGQLPPPAGTPGYFAEVDDSAFSPVPQDQMSIWQFHVDWSNPANSTFGLDGEPNTVLPTAPFDMDMCGFSRSCIKQPGTSQGLDAISDRLMYRLQYRNFGNHFDLVANHTVDADGTDHAGIRWYDVRDSGSGWAIADQGTYAPDADSRWMGSAAMDASGNLAVGFSVSSSTTFPSIRAAGRLAGDPAGELSQGESEMIAGGGSQLHSAARWGDYSDLTLDPVDGCTYWYTTEYLPTTSTADWHTRIGHFKFPNCTQGPSGTLSGTVTDAGNSQAIAGAKVTAGAVTATTDGNGHYAMTLPVGTYTVSATAYGYDTQTANNVAVTDGGTTVQNFALNAVPTVDVSGTVTDGGGHGWPLYAKITIDGYPGAPVFTDPFTGHYAVTLVQNTPFTFHVSAMGPGYDPATQAVTFSTATATQDFALDVDASCTAPGYHHGITGLFEQFESGALPAGWTVTDGVGNGQTWSFDNPGNRANMTGGDGQFAIVDSDHYGIGNSQDTSLVTPALDLSTVDAPSVRFDSDYHNLGDTADVDVSIDGGTTWTNVWERTTDQRGPDHESIDLPTAAHQANVKVRFHYYDATWAWWWEVDNVAVGGPLGCVPTPGGLVSGLVTDLTTGDAINGAKIQSDDQPAENALSAATPTDPNLDDGFYSVFSSLTGSHPFTASKTNFSSDTKTVNVAADAVTRQDFALGAGHLTINPTSLEVTVPMGGATDKNLAIGNDGTGPADFQLSERDRGSTILGLRGTRVTRISGQFSPFWHGLQKGQGGGGGDAGEPPRPPNAPPWTTVADYPSAIMDNTADAFDGKVYSVGGFDGNSNVSNAYVYDPGSNSWSAIASMAGAREKPAAAFVDGKLYVVGGWDNNGNPDPKLEIYDPSSDSWSTGASIPTAYAASAAVALDGKIYLIGGCQSACGTTDVQVYDTASDSWSSVAAYPEQTSWTACGAIGGLIYCGGGTFANSESQHAYVYDPGTDAWSPIADLPQTRWAAGYVAANGMLVISGGVTNNFSTITNEGFAYDPGSDSWSAIPNSNNTLYRGASACGFYKVGGSIGGFSPVADSELLPGLDECGVPADVTWLSEDPSSGTVNPGDTTNVGVHFDANVAAVNQPGDYLAQLGVKENTPYTVPPIDVTMHVTPPATWGKLQGTVVGLGQCDVPGNPLAKADVHVDGTTQDFDLKTDDNGFFEYWMDQGNSPLAITVHKAGWVDQTHSSVIITAGQTTTNDFTLRLAASCLHATPTSISKTQLLGTTSTATLQITNTGALPANVTLGERGGAFTVLKSQGSPLKLVNGTTGEYTPAFLGGKKGTKAPGVNAGAPLAPTWSTIAAFPVGIMDNGADIIDGKLYVVGGIDAGFTVSNKAYQYDPSTDVWTALPNMSVAREKPAVAAVNGKLFVSGGWDANGTPVALTEVYDPNTNSWGSASANPHPAAGPGVAVDGNTIYFVGGCADSGCTTTTNVVAYDTAADSWSSVANYPHNDAWQACGGINGKIYCSGGTDGVATFKDGFAYDPGADAWSPIASMPLDLWASASGAPNGLLVLSGGVTDGFNTITNQGVAYDPSTDTWSAIPNAQFPRYRGAGSCGFYKVGGSSGGFSPTADSEKLSELDQCGTVDVPWLSEAPSTFTVAADTGSASVTVTLAATLANGVDQPGTYTAQIIVGHNTRDVIGPVNVTLNVTPPKTWGKITGTVSGKDCQGNVVPLLGAQVHLSGKGLTKELSTAANGTYSWWFDVAASPVSLIVSKDGWVSQTKTKIQIKKLKTTTVNFTLVRVKC